MARRPSEGTLRLTDDIHLEGGLSSSPSRIESFSTEDEDYFTYQRDPKAPGLVTRALGVFGMSNVRRRGEYDHSAPLLDEPRDGLLAPPKRQQRETRTCRKGHVCGSLKRVVVALPFVALMLL